MDQHIHRGQVMEIYADVHDTWCEIAKFIDPEMSLQAFEDGKRLVSALVYRHASDLKVQKEQKEMDELQAAVDTRDTGGK